MAQAANPDTGVPGDYGASLDATTTAALYGTASDGGTYGYGVVYKVDQSGKGTVLYSFTGNEDGASPVSGVVFDSAGNLYGTTLNGGYHPSPVGFGVVFMLDTNNKETVLRTFTGPDGAYPYAGVILSAGNLYGTTGGGGTHSLGVVFKLYANGKESSDSFAGTNGAFPQSGLTRDSSGNLYGTAQSGGAPNAGAGVVYKVDPAGKKTVLYAFTGGADGNRPIAGVIVDSAGNLYGTTASGGVYGQGVVYRLDPTGQETVLYSFTGGADGDGPVGGVIVDSAGNFYGTTSVGGRGHGVVYKLDATGKETVLHTFTGGTDGSSPFSGVIRDSAGNLFGTTLYGGDHGFGVVFKVAPTGKETVLYSFTGGIDGGHPQSGVTLSR